jgi:hypothetical protein
MDYSLLLGVHFHDPAVAARAVGKSDAEVGVLNIQSSAPAGSFRSRRRTARTDTRRSALLASLGIRMKREAASVW